MKNIWQIGHKYKVKLKDMEEKKKMCDLYLQDEKCNIQ